MIEIKQELYKKKAAQMGHAEHLLLAPQIVLRELRTPRKVGGGQQDGGLCLLATMRGAMTPIVKAAVW